MGSILEIGIAAGYWLFIRIFFPKTAKKMWAPPCWRAVRPNVWRRVGVLASVCWVVGSGICVTDQVLSVLSHHSDVPPEFYWQHEPWLV
jgi:hypothetical protein